MSELALHYPLGRPIAQAVAVRRQRYLPPGARVLVAAGDQVLPEQPIADGGQSGGGAAVLAGLAGVVAEVVPGRRIAIESEHTSRAPYIDQKVCTQRAVVRFSERVPCSQLNVNAWV